MDAEAPWTDTTYVQRNWLDFRHWLGRWATPKERLQAHCLMSGYRPLEPWLPYHLTEPGVRVNEEGVEYLPMHNKLALGGTGGGKSEASIHQWVMAIEANPGSDHLMGMPTLEQIRKVVVQRYASTMQAMAENGFLLQRRWYGGTTGAGGVMSSALEHGGVASFRSLLKDDNLRGPEYASAWVDEIDMIGQPAKTMSVIRGRIRCPRANRHFFLASTTPNGTEGTVVGHFIEMRKDKSLRSEWVAVRVNWHQNPFLPANYRETNSSGMSRRRFRQEMLGEILGPLEAVYAGEFDRQRHLCDYTFDPSKPYTIGFDGGDQWEHAVAMQQNSRRQWVVFGEWIADETATRAVREAAFVRWTDVHIGRRPSHIFYDYNHKQSGKFLRREYGGTALVDNMRGDDELLVANGIELIRTGLDPIDGEPTLLFSRKLFVEPIPPRSIAAAVEHYRYRCFADGSIDVSSPLQDGVTEHAADAWRYGYVGANRKPRGPMVVQRYGRTGIPRDELPRRRRPII